MEKMFVNLHTHTEYSLLDGMSKVSEIVERAKKLGMSAIAVTEHGNMHSYYKFYKACLDQEVKPILGCEMYVCDNRTQKTKEVLGEYNHLVLLAKDNEGLSNLIKIVSDGSLVGFYRKPRTDFEFLKDHGKGIIALSACQAGIIPTALLSDYPSCWETKNKKRSKKLKLARSFSKLHTNRIGYQKAKELVDLHKRVFDEFYLELEASDTYRQKVLNNLLVKLAKETNTPLVVTNDSHYTLKEDAEVHEILLAIQTNSKLSDPNRFKLDSNCYWFKTEEETIEYLKLSGLNQEVIEEAINNTASIAEKCNIELELDKFHFPEVDIPEGETASSYLAKEANKGLREIVKTFGLNYKKYKERLDYELKTICEMGFAEYFLVVKDIYDYAKRENIAAGPARGSAGGALVSRCLGITKIDPILHDLSFERFLCPGRISMPDIDCDFSPAQRKKLFQYLIDKYGAEKCAHIATFGTLNPRMLIRDIGRAYDIPLEIVDQIAKTVPEIITDEESGDKIDITIDNALTESEILQEFAEKYPHIFKAARRLEGLPRHTSVHAAGIIITPRPLFGNIPLMRNKDPLDPLAVTMVDMHDIEDLKYVKMDLLGVEALTIIDECIYNIEKNHNIKVDLLKVSLNDPKVYDNICSMKNFGIFQICTNVGKKMVSKIQPNNFNELVDILALARPGPMKSGQDQEYIMRKIGLRPVKYPHIELKPLLEKTYGLFLYQEQCMAITRILAGFDHVEADQFRKGMAKKHPEIITGIKSKFLEGCKNLGKVNEETAEKIWDQLERFAGYGFNLSHAVAYAYITYWMAWLKTYYPTEFMAATLTSEYRGNGADKNIKVAEAISECRNMGIKILQPNINESTDKFEVITNKKIRFPISAIKGVGEKAAEAILGNKPYENLEDFVERVPKRNCNKKIMQILILAGAFDFYHPNRLALIQLYFQLRGDKPSNEITVDRKTKIKLPESIDYDYYQMLEWENILLGAYVSGHPLAEMETDSWKNKEPGSKVTIIGKVYDHKTLEIKRGKSAGRKMSIVNIDTFEGQLNVVLFADEHEKFHEKIRKNNIIKVTGKLGERNGEVQVVANGVTIPRIAKK